MHAERQGTSITCPAEGEVCWRALLPSSPAHGFSEQTPQLGSWSVGQKFENKKFFTQDHQKWLVLRWSWRLVGWLSAPLNFGHVCLVPKFKDAPWGFRSLNLYFFRSDEPTIVAARLQVLYFCKRDIFRHTAKYKYVSFA